MKNKKQKSKKFLFRRIIAIVIIVMVFCGIRNLVYNINAKNHMKQTRLMLDNNIIQLKDKINIEDESIYISEEDIQEIFDKTIYYNVGDKELITTYNKHVAVLHLDDNEARINDSISKMQGTLKEIDNKIYLPVSDLGIVYDIEINYSKDTNLAIMDSIAKAKSKVSAKKNINLKTSKNPFSINIEKVKKYEDLYIIEDLGKFLKVRTKSGNIGYVKTNKVSEKQVLREDLEEKKDSIYILKEYSKIQKYENPNLEKNKDNVVIIDAFGTAKDNSVMSLIKNDSEDYKNYVSWAEENEIDIIGNYENGLTVSVNFATYQQRNELINQLYTKVMQNSCKGVSMTFEEIDDINSFYRFLIEITPKFKESGLKVFVKLNDKMDGNKVKEIVDYTF